MRNIATGEEQDETDAMLFDLSLECARPSWRFRFLFGARERQLLGYAVNTFMGQRHRNLFLAELDRRYLNQDRRGGEATQAGVACQQPIG